MKKSIPFLKGHMGGNEIILAPRRVFPKESELELGLKVMEPPHIGGDQLGLLYEGSENSHLRARIIDLNSRDYLPMCGGLTQVLGKAHRDINLPELFKLNFPEPGKDFFLETGLDTFSISNDDGGSVITDMSPFVEAIYDKGVEAGKVRGVQSFRVGDFFVTFVEEIIKKFPDASFNPLDQPTKRTLIELQDEFQREFATGKKNRDFAVVGKPEEDSSSDGRLIFPHNLSEGLIEPACGTGTIAVAIGMIERGSIIGSGNLKLRFESGGKENYIGGPDTTEVVLKVESGRVKGAQLSHSQVEVLAAGKLYI